MSPRSTRDTQTNHPRDETTRLAQVVEGLPGVGLPYLLARKRDSFSTSRFLLIVTADDDRAATLASDLRAFGVHDVALFPGDTHVTFEDVSPDPHAVFARLQVRQRIISNARPNIVVASAT